MPDRDEEIKPDYDVKTRAKNFIQGLQRAIWKEKTTQGAPIKPGDKNLPEDDQ